MRMDSLDKHGSGAGNIKGISLFETMRSLALTLEKKARNRFDHFVYSWNLGCKTGRSMFAFVGKHFQSVSFLISWPLGFQGTASQMGFDPRFCMNNKAMMWSIIWDIHLTRDFLHDVWPTRITGWVQGKTCRTTTIFIHKFEDPNTWFRKFSMIFPSISPWLPCDMPHVLPIEFPSKKPRLNPHGPQEHVVALQLANDQCHARARAEGEHGIRKRKETQSPKRWSKKSYGSFGSIM